MMKRGKLIFYGVLLALLFFALVNITVKARGTYFGLELFGLIVLLILTLVGFTGYTGAWGEGLLSLVFLLYLVNLILIWSFIGPFYVIPAVIALIGFFISLPGKGGKSSKERVSKTVSKEPHSMVFDQVSVNKSSKDHEMGGKLKKEPERKANEPRKVMGKVISTTELRKEGEKAAAKYIPGKYVASRNSNVYHEPRCEWAKKIVESRRVWFNEKQEAWEKGYKKHDCVK